jgi:phosphoribosylpyrophosphate synthetase
MLVGNVSGKVAVLIDDLADVFPLSMAYFNKRLHVL